MTILAIKATVVRSAARNPTPRVRKEGSLAVPLAPLRSMNKEVRKARNVNPVAIEERKNGDEDIKACMSLPIGLRTRMAVRVREIKSVIPLTPLKKTPVKHTLGIC
jgi:hypothetical protein